MTFNGWLSCVIISIVAPAIAWADEMECSTKDGRITFNTSSDKENKIQIRYLDEKTKKDISHTGWIFLETGGDPQQPGAVFTAIQTAGSGTRVSENNQQMHIFHKNGKGCKGRIKFDEAWERPYRIGDKDGKPLNTYGAFVGKKIPYMMSSGYIEATFICHEKSITTADGCFEEKGDKVTWEKFTR